MNRRLFLENAVKISAGTLLSNTSLNAFAQSRKEVLLNGKKATIIDIHAHCLFREVAPLITGTKLGNASLDDILVLGTHRIDDLDERGIDIAALSVNRYWWYEGDDLDQAKAIVRMIIGAIIKGG